MEPLSQISTFWDSVHAMEQDVRRALKTAGNGMYAERYWCIKE
jgi:hypothetical protein